MLRNCSALKMSGDADDKLVLTDYEIGLLRDAYAKEPWLTKKQTRTTRKSTFCTAPMSR